MPKPDFVALRRDDCGRECSIFGPYFFLSLMSSGILNIPG